MNYWEWLKIGLDSNWISHPVCDTHDGVPLTDEEIAFFDENYERPCIVIARLWGHEKIFND